MADFPVKWYRHDMAGAPVIRAGYDGDVLAALQAILVTGFNEKEPDTLTYDAQSGEAIAEFNAGSHGYLIHQVIEVSGADQAEYNGLWRVAETTSTQVRFTIDAAPAANGSGTITVKTPGAGWAMPFISGDGKRAAFKPDNVEGSGVYWYVEDNHSESPSWAPATSSDYQMSYIRGVTSMNDIDDRGAEFGYGLLHGTYMDSSAYDNASTPTKWAVVADKATCYFHHEARGTDPSLYSSFVVFGDLVSPRRPVKKDAFCFLMRNATSSAEMNADWHSSYAPSDYRRVDHGVGIENARIGLVGMTDNSGLDGIFNFPGQDGMLPVHDKVYSASEDGGFIGRIPGIVQILSNTQFPNWQPYEYGESLYLSVVHPVGVNSGSAGCSFIDIAGPWE